MPDKLVPVRSTGAKRVSLSALGLVKTFVRIEARA